MKTATKRKRVATIGEFNASELLGSLDGFAEQLKSGAVHNLRTTTINLPEPLPKRTGEEVRAVREKLGTSQAVFAALLNVPRATLKSWEENRRTPTGAALKLLQIAMTFPEIFVGADERAKSAARGRSAGVHPL